MFVRTALAASLLSLAACQSMTPPATAPVAPAAPAAAAAAPPPAWQQGRSADQASSKLAPLAGRLTATPASEIPVSTFKLPPGFTAEIWATGMPGARAMARGEGGKIYIGTRGIGRVYEVTDNGTQRTSRVVVDKLVQPSGVALMSCSSRARDRGTARRSSATTW
jgi:glucose/arabinose dehydrogenase